jgi:hypothetical protein
MLNINTPENFWFKIFLLHIMVLIKSKTAKVLLVSNPEYCIVILAQIASSQVVTFELYVIHKIKWVVLMRDWDERNLEEENKLRWVWISN